MSTKCWLSVDQVLFEMSIVCQLRCWLQAVQGYWSPHDHNAFSTHDFSCIQLQYDTVHVHVSWSIHDCWPCVKDSMIEIVLLLLLLLLLYHYSFVSNCVCCYMNITLHELSWQGNRLRLKSFWIKWAVSTLRAHFYVISFTKNDLRMSIISTTLNNFERIL